MNTKPTHRLIAAAASTIVTWTLFTAVTMLAAPPAEATLMAQAQVAVVR